MYSPTERWATSQVSKSSMPSSSRLRDAKKLSATALAASGRCLSAGTCTASSSALGGTCVAPPATGQACATGSGRCNSSLDYCSSAGTCARSIAVGQSCPDAAGCVGYAYCQSGACVAQGKPGEACDGSQPSGYRNCMGSLYCNNGICTLPDPAPVCP